MAKYLFALEKLHINAARNNHPAGDWDVITFGIEVGVRQYGPLPNYSAPPVNSGSDIDFTKSLRRDAQNIRTGRWEIGPIEVGDNDVASVNYSVVNAQEALSNSQDTTLATNIALGVWVLLVGITAGAFGGPPGQVVTALAAAIAGGAIAVFGGPFHCDGVVGGNKRVLTGAELRDATNNAERKFSISEQSGNPAAPDHCGQSDIVMTFSVTRLPYYSVKDFLLEKFGGPRGPSPDPFKADTNYEGLPGFYNGPSTSVRYVIENWEMLIVQ
jgi:hypothetical protein